MSSSKVKYSHWYTTLVLRFGLGHNWMLTIGWVLLHSIITGFFVFMAGLAENIIYDAWTYVWFGAWICFVFIIRRTTTGYADLLGVPSENGKFYTPEIRNYAKGASNELNNKDLSKTANAFLFQPLELVLGLVAYVLFASGFIPWSYDTGLYGQLPYPWFDLVLITNLLFFFIDYLFFASAVFLVFGLLFTILRAKMDTDAALSEAEKNINLIGFEDPKVIEHILKYPRKLRKIGHILADVTLGAFGMVLLLQLYWLISNTLKGIELSWTGLALNLPLFICTFIAFILPQKKLHDTLSPYWNGLRSTYSEFPRTTNWVIGREEMSTTVLENSKRYKFGILMIFIFGCALIDYHIFQLIGLEIWTVVGMQIAVMAGLMQGWQFVE